MDDFHAGYTLESGSPCRLSQQGHDSGLDICYISESDPEPSPSPPTRDIEETLNFTLNDTFMRKFKHNNDDEMKTTDDGSFLAVPTSNSPNNENSLEFLNQSVSGTLSDVQSEISINTEQNDSCYFSNPNTQSFNPENISSPSAEVHSCEIKFEPSPKTQTITINTYYEMPRNETEFIQLEKKLQALNSEEELEKMMRDPETSSYFDDLFGYFSYKLAKAGIISPKNVMSIGKTEDVITINPDELFNEPEPKSPDNDPSHGVNEDVNVSDEELHMDVDNDDNISQNEHSAKIQKEYHQLNFKFKSELNKSPMSLPSTMAQPIVPSFDVAGSPDHNVRFSPSYQKVELKNSPATLNSIQKQLSCYSNKTPIVLPPIFPKLPSTPLLKNEPSFNVVEQCEPEEIIVKPEILLEEEEIESITERIEKEIHKLIMCLVNHEPLVIHVRNRNKWDNCVLTPLNTISLKSSNDAEFKQINFSHEGSEKYFTLFIYLLGEIYKLLMTNTTCTKRELYYRDPDLTESQRYVDVVLNDISCFLEVPLWKLGVLSSSKGLVVGDLVIVMKDGTVIDGRQDRGVVVPADICAIQEIQSSAKYILIVEKDTVFKKLLDDDIFNQMESQMILITGKGYPDVNTRHLVKYLIDTLSIPTYILCDADPHGIEIMFTYRFGSLALSHLENLASPEIQWIGIRPSDIDDFEIPSIPLTEEDFKKIDELLERPYITEDLQKQLTLMKTKKVKAEIEALSTFSSTYLVDQYLPSTIHMSNFR